MECPKRGQFISTIVQSWDSFAIDTICCVLRAYHSKQKSPRKNPDTAENRP
jgi:hypothetical protein